MMEIFEPQKSHAYADELQRERDEQRQHEWDGVTSGTAKLTYGYL